MTARCCAERGVALAHTHALQIKHHARAALHHRVASQDIHGEAMLSPVNIDQFELARAAGYTVGLTIEYQLNTVLFTKGWLDMYLNAECPVVGPQRLTFW